MTTPSPTPPIDFAQLDALKAGLDRHRPLPPDMVANLRADMVLRYTFHSNAIEGNTLTLMETKVVLEDGVTIGGKSMREHLEAPHGDQGGAGRRGDHRRQIHARAP